MTIAPTALADERKVEEAPSLRGFLAVSAALVAGALLLLGQLPHGSETSVLGDWRPSPDGLALEPGGHAEVQVDVAPPNRGTAVLNLWFHAGNGLHNAVDCSSDGREFRLLVQDHDHDGTLVDLGSCLDGRADGRLFVRFRGWLDATAPEPRLSLDKLRLTAISTAGRMPQINAYLAGALVLMCFFVACVPGTLNTRWQSSLALLIGAGILAFACLLRWSSWSQAQAIMRPAGLPWTLGPFAICLSCLWARWYLRDRRHSPAALVALTVTGVVSVGFLLRWEELTRKIGIPLDPDASTVAAISRLMHSPYDTVFREPMWIWLLKLTTTVYGEGVVETRLFSLFVSTVLVGVVYVFLRDVTGHRSLALLVALLTARHPFLVDSASRGLRTELITLSLLGVSYFVFVPELSRRQRWLGLAAGTPFLLLTQFSGLAVALVAMGYGLIMRRIDWRMTATALFFAGIAILPHLRNNARGFTDPFWSSSGFGAVFYRNYEYLQVKKTGCDGCPSLQEYASDSTSGRHLTMFQYMFGMHTTREVVSRMVDGYGQAFLRRGSYTTTLLGSARGMVYLLYLCGGVLLLLSRWRSLLLIPLSALNFLSFVIPLDIDPRLVTPGIPIVILMVSLPLWSSVVWGWRRLGPWRLRLAQGAPSSRR
jgi:hypothetical protein